MNSLHLDDDRLLRYADGELGYRDAQRVRSHLESCWECRAELDQIHRTIGACVRYRKAVRQLLPPPPKPWMDIHLRFAEVDQSLARPSFWARFAAVFSAPTRWVPAAAAAALLIVVLYNNRELPTVSAAELLDKAVSAEQARPATPRRYQIRTRGRQVTDPQMIRKLETLALASHYSWDAPLSAASYKRWHDQLPSRRDEVLVAPNYYQIRTSTDASELVEASLRLRSADYIPVESTLQFRDQDRIEITELPAEQPLAVTAPVPAPTAAPALAPTVPAALPTTADELRVFAALRKLGADLGEPIEITRTSDAIVVTALETDAVRRQQLERELSPLAHVRVQFTDIAPSTAAPASPTLLRGNSASPFETELNQFFGGQAAIDRFTDQALELTDAILARAHALRRLSEHFPASAVATLSPADRQTLDQLVAAHAAALAQSARALNQLATPVLDHLHAGAPSPRTLAANPLELLRAARQVEQLLAHLFTGAAGAPSADAPTALRAALADLSNLADIYLNSPPQ
jgi:anti-sigma factor RsiW